VRTTASDVALHRRHLNEVSASTVGEFTAAIADSSINKILLAAGTYELISSGHNDGSGGMCGMYGGPSAVCITRALTIEAEVPGAVVLKAMGWWKVIEIQSGGTGLNVELIGLNITGGSGSWVQSVCLLNLPWHSSITLRLLF
jgi:hypothetical protein